MHTSVIKSYIVILFVIVYIPSGNVTFLHFSVYRPHDADTGTAICVRWPSLVEKLVKWAMKDYMLTASVYPLFATMKSRTPEVAKVRMTSVFVLHFDTCKYGKGYHGTALCHSLVWPPWPCLLSVASNQDMLWLHPTLSPNILCHEGIPKILFCSRRNLWSGLQAIKSSQWQAKFS